MPRCTGCTGCAQAVMHNLVVGSLQDYPLVEFAREVVYSTHAAEFHGETGTRGEIKMPQ
jgi:hypothetical protein